MNRFIFSQQNTDTTTGLYASDGTANGTVRLVTSGLRLSPFDAAFTPFDGKLLFLGAGSQDPNGTMVYATDGTANGTTASLVSGAGGLAKPTGLWTLGNTVLTSGTTLTGSPGIWTSTDGVAFKTIETGVGSAGFVTSHGIEYFNGLKGNGDTVSAGLWRTDGTAAGTYSINQTVNPLSIASIGNGLTVFTSTSADGITRLWTTAGTAAGTSVLSIPGLGTGLAESELTSFNGRAVFSTRDATHHDVWITDGTVAGTQEIYANDGQMVRDPVGFTPWGSKLLFTNGYDLLATDGTAAGTYTIPSSYPVTSFVALGNQIIFIAADHGANAGTDGGFALFFSDGTAAGTHQFPARINVENAQLVVSGNRVVFAAVDTSGKEAFFSTDGTIAGTSELALPAGVTLDANNPPQIAALPDPVVSGNTTTLLGQSASGPLSFKVVDNFVGGKTTLQLDVVKATGGKATLREFIDNKYVGVLHDNLADGSHVITNAPLAAGLHSIRLILDGSVATATASFTVPTLADFTSKAKLGTVISAGTTSGSLASTLPDVTHGTAIHLLGAVASSGSIMTVLHANHG